MDQGDMNDEEELESRLSGRSPSITLPPLVTKPRGRRPQSFHSANSGAYSLGEDDRLSTVSIITWDPRRTASVSSLNNQAAAHLPSRSDTIVLPKLNIRRLPQVGEFEPVALPQVPYPMPLGAAYNQFYPPPPGYPTYGGFPPPQERQWGRGRGGDGSELLPRARHHRHPPDLPPRQSDRHSMMPPFPMAPNLPYPYPVCWPYVPSMPPDLMQYISAPGPPWQWHNAVDLQRPDGRLSGVFSPRHNQLAAALHHTAFADRLVDSLLENWLAVHIVPSVLLEVFIDQDRESHSKDVAASHAARLVADDVMDGIIKQQVRSVVRQTLNDLVEKYFAKDERYNPLVQQVYDDLIGRLIRGTVVDVVKCSIAEKVEEHMMLVRASAVAEDLLLESMRPICSQEARQALADQTWDDMLWEVYGQHLTPTVAAVCREVMQEEVECRRKVQVDHISKSASNWLLERLVLERLLHHASSKGEDIKMQYFQNHFLNEVMFDSLLQRWISCEDAAHTTVQCQPLRRVHASLFHTAALDVLLDEFVGHCDQDFEEYEAYEASRVDHMPSLLPG